MIYGETEHDGVPLLNTRWPQRGLFHVRGMTEGGQAIEAYAWDDCEGDAIESTLEWCGEEGSDDSGLHVFLVAQKLRAAITETTNNFNARDD